MTLDPSTPREPNGRRSRNTSGQLGRPIGAKNKSTSKTATRLRQRKFRAKQYDLAIEAAEAEMESRKSSESTIRYLRQNGFTLFGELGAIGPIGFPVDAQTAEEELQLAKEFATALNLPDIRPGQTIRNFINEVLHAWCANGARMFNRATGQFADTEFEGLNPDEYTYPDGVDEAPIQNEVPNV